MTMDIPNGDFSLPGRIIMGPDSGQRLDALLDRYASTPVVILADPPSLRNGVTAGLAKALKARGLKPNKPLEVPRPPLTAGAVASAADGACADGVGLRIAVGGSGAMECAALFSRGKPAAGAATILIPTTPLGAMTAVWPLAVTWEPLQEEAALHGIAVGYPRAIILDPRYILDSARTHPTDPGLLPLGLSMEALLGGNGDPFSEALASEAIRRLRPYILPAAGGSEDEVCWQNLVVGGLLAGLAYGRCGTARGWALARALALVYCLDWAALAGILLPEIIGAAGDSAAWRVKRLACLLGTCWPSPVAAGRQLLDCTLGSPRAARPTALDPIRDWVRDTVREAAPGDFSALGRYARQMAHQALDNFQFIDQWSNRQTLTAVAGDLRTLNRQVAFLMDRPLNLREAGISDRLAKLDQVVAVAREIHDRLAPWGPWEDRDLADWIYAAHRTRQTPLEVDPDQLEASGGSNGGGVNGD